MPSRVVRVRSSDDGVAARGLRDGIAAIQAEMQVSPDFPAEVETAAKEAAARPRLPDLDRTDIPFVTIDPAGARDLDQALHIERAGDGYTVFYAIADLAAFITPGDPVDLEAHRRGETLYGADSKVPLHPKAISEDAGSLLAGQERPALLWTLTVDATGEGTEVRVERARVRSRAQLSYDEVQAAIDAGTADEVFALLREVGELRIARETRNGGVSLPLPEQEIDVVDDRWLLEFRSLHPVEGWNAQISLLTGMGAAHLMVEGRTGLLRTLPPADPRDVRATAAHRPRAAGSTGPSRWTTRRSSTRSTRRSRRTRRWSSPARDCCAAAGTSGSTARCPTSRGTPGWPRSTPTAPPRCAASSTGTPARSASR